MAMVMEAEMVVMDAERAVVVHETVVMAVQVKKEIVRLAVSFAVAMESAAVVIDVKRAAAVVDKAARVTAWAEAVGAVDVKAMVEPLPGASLLGLAVRAMSLCRG